jgi:hypothetical protein
MPLPYYQNKKSPVWFLLTCGPSSLIHKCPPRPEDSEPRSHLIGTRFQTRGELRRIRELTFHWRPIGSRGNDAFGIDEAGREEEEPDALSLEAFTFRRRQIWIPAIVRSRTETVWGVRVWRLIFFLLSRNWPFSPLSRDGFSTLPRCAVPRGRR